MLVTVWAKHLSDLKDFIKIFHKMIGLIGLALDLTFVRC